MDNETKLVERAEKSIVKYFNSFEEAKLSGVTVNVYPVEYDIPHIKCIYYNKKLDTLSIEFNNFNRSDREEPVHSMLIIHYDNSGIVSGFTLSNLKLYPKYRKEIKNIINDEIHRKNISDVKFDIRRNDIKKRLMKFMKEYLDLGRKEFSNYAEL